MRIHRVFFFIPAAVILFLSQAFADSPSATAQRDASGTGTRYPVPPTSAILSETKSIDGIFRQDISNAVTLEQKKGLAAKMMRTGIDENSDILGKYVLLHRAMETYIAACDLRDACRTIDVIAEKFTVDKSKMMADALTSIGRSPSTRKEGYLEQAEIVADDAEQNDDYNLAKIALDQALSAAGLVGDHDDAAEINERISLNATLRTAYLVARPAEALLRTNPDDPDANLKSGRFRCFIKGQWGLGLYRLQKCSVIRLAKLASQELANNHDSTAQNALADGWWDAAEMETGIAKANIRRHAVDIYNSASTGLTGLALARVQKRITEAAEGFTPHLVNLVRLVDIDKDVVSGKWAIKDGILSCEEDAQPVIEFPYQPPEEYDFRITFSRRSGSGDVLQLCYAAGHQFAWAMGAWNNTLAGFDVINGKSIAQFNPTRIESRSWLTNNTQAVSIVKVRRAGVEAFLDGKLLDHWKTDYHEMSLRDDIHLPLKTGIGLDTWNSAADFVRIQVLEISGPGRLLR